MAYDIIGDVHGQAGKLKALLRRLGYAARNGTWRHSDPLRTAVFVGDYIDRGPEQVETIEIVRGMVDKGTARAIRQGRNFARQRPPEVVGYVGANLQGRGDRPAGCDRERP